jgi:formylglycine-generating enzyme required for sulfatase activity
MDRNSVKYQFAEARAQTDSLFALLPEISVYERPIPERHRLIFYLGHLEAFDWNHIAVRSLSQPAFHSSFDRLFEAGIDPDSSSLPTDTPSDWPALAEVCGYRREVRRRLDDLLPKAPAADVAMALEHRLMHAETLAYLIHNLAFDQKIAPAESTPTPEAGEIPSGMVEIPGGLCTLGKGRHEGFGWDNEYDEHFVRVPAFRIDRRKVTNGEYLEFVKNGAKPPHYWMRRDGKWLLRTMFEAIPLPLDWPVYVTQVQAVEFAQWKGRALPSEAQFHRAAFGCNGGEERAYPWGDEEPEPRHGNFGFSHWNPCSVNATPDGDSYYGVAQLTGNGWEWTSTVFEPFHGFEPMSGYPGYSANFFDGQHYVMKGASPRTAQCFLRRSFRNWFRPNYPYVYAGFRCVEC